jgi:hypothetical protein
MNFLEKHKQILLYLGAGYDISPLIGIDNTKIFIYNDINYDDEYCIYNQDTKTIEKDKTNIIIPKYIKEQLKYYSYFNPEYTIVKEKLNKFLWKVHFKNGKILIYIFQNFPGKQTFFDKIYKYANILYVDGFILNDNLDTYKKISKIDSVYWSASMNPFLINKIMQIYPSAKLTHTLMRKEIGDKISLCKMLYNELGLE